MKQSKQRKTREHLLMALFAQDFHKDTLKGEKSTEPVSLWDMYQSDPDHFTNEEERKQVNHLLKDINKYLKDIDKLIEQTSHSWKMKRIFIIDLNIMRLALYEMFYARPRVPFKVCVDEAVEIAKIYGTENSTDFVNGNLDAIYKKNQDKKNQDKKLQDKKPQKGDKT